jgi:hypothetical protein
LIVWALSGGASSAKYGGAGRAGERPASVVKNVQLTGLRAGHVVRRVWGVQRKYPSNSSQIETGCLKDMAADRRNRFVRDLPLLAMETVMKIMLAAIAAATLFAAAPAFAQEGPSFETGPVWDFDDVQTKDGHFDDYMAWLDTGWKAQEEALMKAGVIIGYKVYLIQNPRVGEPDIVLAQEYKNMAAFDRSVAEGYALQAKIGGSMAKANAEQAARSSIRTILGSTRAREAILK